MTYKAKSRVRDHNELLTAAKQVHVEAHNFHQPVALIGGLAMQVYGSTRLTGDIDVVTNRPIATFHRARPLSFGGYQSIADNGVPVDVVIRNDDFDKLYTAALRHAVMIQGIPIRVVRPEYLVAMKMVADRPRDDNDFDYLVTDGPTDLKKAEEIVRKYLGPYGAQDFVSRVQVAKWKKSVGKL
jgi:hypothetical protein